MTKSSMTSTTCTIAECDNHSKNDVYIKWAIEPDEALVIFALAGDNRAFEYLFHRYKKRIVSICLKINGGDYAQALDLCQETFLSAYSRLHQLKDHRRFFAWISEIARNKSISYVREQTKLAKMLGDYDVVKETVADNEQHWSEAEIQVVEDLIQGIDNPKIRETIQLFYLEGKKTNEIAELQGVSQTAITTRLNRFRIKFRRHIISELLK
ncbi:MAG: RNA polymerase sigma factor [Gammaproteobacteria bacterium]